jgi:hypothetical protein
MAPLSQHLGKEDGHFRGSGRRRFMVAPHREKTDARVIKGLGMVSPCGQSAHPVHAFHIHQIAHLNDEAAVVGDELAVQGVDDGGGAGAGFASGVDAGSPLGIGHDAEGPGVFRHGGRGFFGPEDGQAEVLEGQSGDPGPTDLQKGSSIESFHGFLH